MDKKPIRLYNIYVTKIGFQPNISPTGDRALGLGRLTRESLSRFGGLVVGLMRAIELDGGREGMALTRLEPLIQRSLSAPISYNVQAPLPDLDTRQADIERAYRAAKYWHGTGRYQNGPDGETRDLLESILVRGLLPAQDMADMVQGPGETVSVTCSRMYARVYAQTHSSVGEQLTRYYGGQSFWGGVFNGATLHDLLKSGETRNLMRNYLQNDAVNHGKGRVRSRGVTVINYLLGSNIPNNYPIIIGLDESAFNPVEISEHLARYEMRSAVPIPVSHFTHIECPYSKVEETAIELEARGVRIPVLAIEATEEYLSQFSIRDLT
jgi:hypothetical protein